MEFSERRPPTNRERASFARLNRGGLGFGRIDFDAALEVGAIFDADAGGGNVADDGAVFFDVDAAAGVDITHNLAENNQFTSVNFGIELSCGTHGEFVAVERDGTVYFAVNLEVFFANDFTLDGKAGPEARGTACAGTAEPRRRGCVEWNNR